MLCDIQLWSDEELKQVYQLQMEYEKTVLDFVRHGEKNDVYKFMRVIPKLHSYDGETPFVRNGEEASEEELKQVGKEVGDLEWYEYVYADYTGHYKTSDSLRDIYEDAFQDDLCVGRPRDLAVFANKYEYAPEGMSAVEFDLLRYSLPDSLVEKVNALMAKYPESVQTKAMEESVYGNAALIDRAVLYFHRKGNMPEYMKIDTVCAGQELDTIVKAYDLQANLAAVQPKFRQEDFVKIFRERNFSSLRFLATYGRAAESVLLQADHKALELAKKFDFYHTEERVPVLENHKICLFGNREQKVALREQINTVNLSGIDAFTVLDALAEKYEISEKFTPTYFPNGRKNLKYAGQTYQLLGRANSSSEDAVPSWNIMFDNNKIIKAMTDEIVPSEIIKRNPDLEEIINISGSANTNRKLTPYGQGKERILQGIRLMKENGVAEEHIRNLLNTEVQNLTQAQAR